MADCGTPFSRRRALSLDGVRATDGDSANYQQKEKQARLRAVQSYPALRARTRAARVQPPVAP